MSSDMHIGMAISHAGEGLLAKQKISLGRVRTFVENGQSISSVFARELRYPSAIVGIIACGESSGNLSSAFKCSHALLEREDDLIKKCVSALVYPCVIGAAAVVLVIGLVRGVMPQIIPLLVGMHVELPVLTKGVMKMSEFMMSYGIEAGAVSVLFVSVMVVAYRKLPQARILVHRLGVRVPLFGNLIERYALAVFFQSMGALTESGMAADVAYQKAVAAISLIPLRKKLETTMQSITNGATFGSIFAHRMPAYIAPLIAAGEASGNLASAFSRAAAILDRELDYSLKHMTGLIEPIMMIGMGLSVGAIALSIMMPIYDISKNLQH